MALLRNEMKRDSVRGQGSACKSGEKKAAGRAEIARSRGSSWSEWKAKSRVAAQTPTTPCLIRVRLARSRPVSHGVRPFARSKQEQTRRDSSHRQIDWSSQLPGSKLFPIEQLLVQQPLVHLLFLLFKPIFSIRVNISRREKSDNGDRIAIIHNKFFVSRSSRLL